MGVMTVSVFVGVAVLFGRWWGGVVWERVGEDGMGEWVSGKAGDMDALAIL